MGRLVTVSAKIPEELKRRMEGLGIKPSRVIREAIEREVRRREAEKLLEVLDEAKLILDKLSVERAIKSIREDRDYR